MPMFDLRTYGEALSQLIGWSYFLCWTISFYPQAILNFRRKSVVGLSVDFIVLNILGFTFYSIYNIVFYTSDEIRKEYLRRHPRAARGPLVRPNDIFFAVHAAIISIFTLSQVYCWGYTRSRRQYPSSWAWGLVAGSIFGVAILCVLATISRITWIGVCYALSSIKLVCSFVKYVPQAILNYKRRSTTGWSIHNILLDFTGGLLSLTQLSLDAFLADDFSGVVGNLPKLGLSLLAMSFDVLFMTQHYLLYRDRKDPGRDERRPILSSEDEA